MRSPLLPAFLEDPHIHCIIASRWLSHVEPTAYLKWLQPALCCPGATWSLAMQLLPLAHLWLADCRQMRVATRYGVRMLLNIPRIIPYCSIYILMCIIVYLAGWQGTSTLRVPKRVIHTLVWCSISKDETLVIKHRMPMLNFTQLANLLKCIQNT